MVIYKSHMQCHPTLLKWIMCMYACVCRHTPTVYTSHGCTETTHTVPPDLVEMYSVCVCVCVCRYIPTVYTA